MSKTAEPESIFISEPTHAHVPLLLLSLYFFILQHDFLFLSFFFFLQYCMPYANQVLSAAAYPAVTNARATGDYFHAKDQWAVGGTSLFYWAIGVSPQETVAS